MLRLALILFGGSVLAARWKIFWTAGMLLVLLGLAIWLDLADGVAEVATSALGAILLTEGAAAMVVALTHASARKRFELWRAGIIIVFACLILDFPWDNSIATWVLVSGAFLFDGLIRIAASLLIRYAHWKRSCVLGAGTLAMAVLLITDWPLPHSLNVEFCVGLGLLVSGVLIARGAWQLRSMSSEARLESIALYGGRATSLPQGQFAAGMREGMAGQEMIVHVWSAVEGAEDPVRLPIIQRYIAAVSRKGGVSTGHAALECGSDIYISHHPRDPMTITRDDFTHKVRATDNNNVPGKWFPSYPEEAQAECPSTYRIRFRSFNRAYLAEFWETYRRDTTYNLTRRNCSVVVARAIDASIEGIFADQPFWRTLLRLVLSSDMWIAGRARVRAGSMAWTPGLVLDYATALRRITHPRRGAVSGPWRLVPRLHPGRRMRTKLR